MGNNSRVRSGEWEWQRVLQELGHEVEQAFVVLLACWYDLACRQNEAVASGVAQLDGVTSAAITTIACRKEHVRIARDNWKM